MLAPTRTTLGTWQAEQAVVAAAPTSSCHSTLEGHLLSPNICFANPRSILALLLARTGLYLERLQKASMTPILQLVLLRPQPQHGLSVPMELVVKVVQQGSPCPVLQEGQRTQPGLQGKSSDTDSCDTNPCDTSSCPLGGSAYPMVTMASSLRPPTPFNRKRWL